MIYHYEYYECVKRWIVKQRIIKNTEKINKITKNKNLQKVFTKTNELNESSSNFYFMDHLTNISLFITGRGGAISCKQQNAAATSTSTSTASLQQLANTTQQQHHLFQQHEQQQHKQQNQHNNIFKFDNNNNVRFLAVRKIYWFKSPKELAEVLFRNENLRKHFYRLQTLAKMMITMF